MSVTKKYHALTQYDEIRVTFFVILRVDPSDRKAVRYSRDLQFLFSLHVSIHLKEKKIFCLI